MLGGVVDGLVHKLNMRIITVFTGAQVGIEPRAGNILFTASASPPDSANTNAQNGKKGRLYRGIKSPLMPRQFRPKFDHIPPASMQASILIKTTMITAVIRKVSEVISVFFMISA